MSIIFAFLLLLVTGGLPLLLLQPVLPVRRPNLQSIFATVNPVVPFSSCIWDLEEDEGKGSGAFWLEMGRGKERQ